MKVSFDLPRQALQRLDHLVFAKKQQQLQQEFPYQNRAEFLRAAVLQILADYDYIRVTEPTVVTPEGSLFDD